MVSKRNKSYVIIALILGLIVVLVIGVTWYFYERSQTISSLSLENKELNNKLAKCSSDKTGLYNGLRQCYLNLSEYVPNLCYMDLEGCNQCCYIYNINNKTDKREVCTLMKCVTIK